MTPERLTTADRFSALKDSLDWYLPRLLASDVEGQVVRGAAIDFLRKQTDADKDRGVDLVARGIIAATLKRSGEKGLEAGSVTDNLVRLFRCLSPDEVAQLIDGSTPPLELERLGSAVEALGKVEAEHAEKSGSEAEVYCATYDDKDLLDAPMPFSEKVGGTRQRIAQLHVSPSEAERLYAVGKALLGAW